MNPQQLKLHGFRKALNTIIDNIGFLIDYAADEEERYRRSRHAAPRVEAESSQTAPEPEKPVEAAPSDAGIAELEALGKWLGAWDNDDRASFDQRGAYAAVRREVLRAIERCRNRQPADRAVEALRGLVEAADEVAACLEATAGDANDVYLSRCWEALRAAKEVLS